MQDSFQVGRIPVDHKLIHSSFFSSPHISNFIFYLSFSVWLTSPSIMSTHVALHGIISLFFCGWVVLYTCICVCVFACISMYIFLSIHMSMDIWVAGVSSAWEMATPSSTLAWEIPWTEEPGGLQSMGLQSQARLSNSTATNSARVISAATKYLLSNSLSLSFSPKNHSSHHPNQKCWDDGRPLCSFSASV